jgi:hypothetical protein
MNLRAALELKTSTLWELSLAAEQRYWDGIQLATSGHFSTSIYYLGFAVEMWLKYACLRYDGATPATFWNAGSFKPIERFLKNMSHAVPNESWHSLRFWTAYLQAKRNYRNHPLDTDIQRALVHRSNRLYGVWWVSMRYFPQQASEYDVRRAYDDAGWFRMNADKLWR